MNYKYEYINLSYKTRKFSGDRRSYCRICARECHANQYAEICAFRCDLVNRIYTGQASDGLGLGLASLDRS